MNNPNEGGLHKAREFCESVSRVSSVNVLQKGWRGEEVKRWRGEFVLFAVVLVFEGSRRLKPTLLLPITSCVPCSVFVMSTIFLTRCLWCHPASVPLAPQSSARPRCCTLPDGWASAFSPLHLFTSSSLLPFSLSASENRIPNVLKSKEIRTFDCGFGNNKLFFLRRK